MVTEEIARLTGKLVFVADYRPLIAFEKRLTAVEGKLRAFSELANRKFNIKVTLDSKTLRAQLDKAMNAKVTLKNFQADMTALNLVEKRICEKLDRTPIRLNNIKINMSAVLAERAMLRQQLGNTVVMTKALINFKEANAAMRAWKAQTEQRFKLHLNADISQAKLFRNAAKTLKTVSARLGTVNIHTPKIKVSIDKQHLRAEIAAVLAQIKREVRIKIDLNGRVSGSPRPRAAARASESGRGLFGGGGLGLPFGALGGYGAMAGLSHLNTVNQQQQGQRMAMLSVTGSAAAGAETKKRLDAMGDELGFNVLKMAPSFIKMIAAGKGSGFTQDQSEQIFKSMTEYGRVMGLNSEEMKGSLRAVEQMMNKGQIMSEELKGQLGERFPAAVALMAKSQGKSIPELLKMMKDGKLSSQALLKFAETLSAEARVGGALGLAKMSTAANQGRAENAMNKSIESFSQGGFDEASSAFFAAIASAFKRNQPAFEAMGQAFNLITKPVIALIEVGGKLLEILPKIASAFGLTGGQLMTLLGIAGIAAAPFGLLALGIAATALALEDLIAFSEGKDSLFGRWIEKMPEAKKAFEELRGTVAGLSNTLDGIFLQIKDLDPALKGLNFSDMLVSTMHEIDLLLKSFTAVVDRMVSAGIYSRAKTQAEGGGFFSSNWNNFVGMFRSYDDNMADAEAYNGKTAADANQAALDNLKTMPNQLDRSTWGSADPSQLEDIARRAMFQQLPPITIEGIKIDIHGDGVLTAANITDGLKEPMEQMAKKVFDDALRTARASQKEVE